MLTAAASPFVASVLRDRAMQDLQTEHEALKEKLNRQQEAQLRVEITGRDGNPVYCQTSMKDGGSSTTRGDIPLWQVFFVDNDDNNTIIPNFIDTVEGLVIRLSGNAIFRFDEAMFGTVLGNNGFDRTRDDVPQMGNVAFVINKDTGMRDDSHGRDIMLFARVGPILYHDFMNTLPQEPILVRDLVIFLNANRNNNNNHNNHAALLGEMRIDSLIFPYSQITGILSLLKSMGISTE